MCHRAIYDRLMKQGKISACTLFHPIFYNIPWNCLLAKWTDTRRKNACFELTISAWLETPKNNGGFYFNKCFFLNTTSDFVVLSCWMYGSSRGQCENSKRLIWRECATLHHSRKLAVIWARENERTQIGWQNELWHFCFSLFNIRFSQTTNNTGRWW